MLELAAKAAGIEGEWVENSLLDEYYKLPTTVILTISEGRVHVWNAETSSWDSFRLAVKLHMFDGSLFELFLRFRLEEVRKDPQRSDDEIARLAIVLTAAEVGKAMSWKPLDKLDTI